MMKRAFYTGCVISLLFLQPNIYAAKFDHSPFDSLLEQFVSDGLVDYGAIKDDPSLLRKYLAGLENLDSSNYKNWNDSEKIAFWINAYNSITIYGVIQNYPIHPGGLVSRIIFADNSIRQISDFWKTNFSPVMGGEITLDEIEHEILRKEFQEPRVHFALVCASIGCPKLQSFAFHPDSLDTQLDRVTREFLRTKGAIIDSADNRILVSKIFEWYAGDFQYADIPDYLTRYDKRWHGFLKFIIGHSPNEIGIYIRENAPKIKFTDYDWSLNEQKK